MRRHVFPSGIWRWTEFLTLKQLSKNMSRPISTGRSILLMSLWLRIMRINRWKRWSLLLQMRWSWMCVPSRCTCERPLSSGWNGHWSDMRGRALHNFYRNIMLSQVFSEVSIATTYRCLNMADAFINLGLNFWLMSIWIKIVRNAQDSLSHNIPVLGIIGPSRGFKTLHLQCRVV